MGSHGELRHGVVEVDAGNCDISVIGGPWVYEVSTGNEVGNAI